MSPVPDPQPHDDDARRELRLVHLVPPLALATAFLAFSSGFAGVFRTFFSMWLHELGHATTAWLAGFAALPGPWRTAIPDERSVFFVLMVAAGLGYTGYRAYRTERHALLGATAAVTALALYLLTRPVAKAQTLITFGGDAGGMVLGALLMLTFYVPPDHHLHTTKLRWGFVVIGAMGFVDPFRTWWIARRNQDVIPYGKIEGVGESDPVKLLLGGWSEPQMIANHVAVGVICLLGLMLAHGLGVRAARRRLHP